MENIETGTRVSYKDMDLIATHTASIPDAEGYEYQLFKYNPNKKKVIIIKFPCPKGFNTGVVTGFKPQIKFLGFNPISMEIAEED